MDSAAASARLRGTALDCFTTPVPGPAWQVKPSTYVVSALDRAIDPGVQRRMAVGLKDVREWQTSHSPFYSHPDAVVGLVNEIVAMTSG